MGLGNYAKSIFDILNSVRDKVQSIQDVIYPTLKDVINSNASVLKEIQNKDQLFNKCQDSKGITIKPSYTKKTISIKLRKGQPTDRVTLNDTGSFYQSVQFIGDDDKLVILAKVDYAAYLTKRYGKAILGIQDMNFEKFYNQYIVPELTENINSIIESVI